MYMKRSGVVLWWSVILGCGSSAQQKLVDQAKATCNESMGSTIAALEGAYSSQFGVSMPILFSYPCSADPSSVPYAVANGRCGSGVPLCLLGFDMPLYTDVCQSSGCYFTCMVVAAESDLEAHEDDGLAPICSTQWVDGQPSPPFTENPPAFVYWPSGVTTYEPTE
jgi:hypothetical protein